MISNLYLGNNLSVLVMSDGLVIEAVFQSLCHSFDAPVLTSPSSEQAVARVVVFLDHFGLPVTSGAVGDLEGR